MRGEEARERIRRIFENGPRLAGFYSFAINNPHLSFWNAVQIYSANPNVTVCKSFDDWHEQDNRRIKRGEHGIVYYDEDNPWRKRHVFDISQTYGKNGLYMSNVKLVGANEYKVGIGDSGIGAITRLENETDGFEKSISSTEKERADEEAKLEQAKIEVEKPFEYAEEVESLQAELSAIDAELDLNKEEAPIVLDNEAEPEKAEIEVLDETEEEVEIV